MMVDNKIVILAGSLTAASAVVLYLLLRKSDNEEYEGGESGERAVTSRQTVLEVRVPRSAIGHVIGRDGSNIRQIQQDTNTRIKFKDSECGSEERVCVIRGKAEATHEAQRLIHKCIRDRPVVTTITISVPQESCGRIIGRNGDTIREMCVQSQAKILVDRNTQTPPDGMRIITLTGTESQLVMAKQLIREKVQLEAEMRRKIAVSTGGRAPRNASKQENITGSSSSYSRDNMQQHPPVKRCESLVATASDGFIEVFVSAVDHPGHFWLQVKSPRSVELDKLGESMTEYYSSAITNNLPESKLDLDNVKVGDLIAARFTHDPLWYRAEVLHIARDTESGAPASLHVYYVDFGDTGRVSVTDQTAPLQPQFMSLTQQAIECFLADVKPVGDTWSEESCECFESLTFAAQWKSIMARVVKYQPSSGGRRLPVVQLIDTNTLQDIDVCKELVKRGYAVWVNNSGVGGVTSVMAESGDSSGVNTPSSTATTVVTREQSPVTTSVTTTASSQDTT